MKKLLCLMGGAMLIINCYAQDFIPKQLNIGDKVPDLPLKIITNYKDDSALLSSFGNKLIILDFWNLHCGACIDQFPFEDSIQKVYSDKIQFLLLTCDPKNKVEIFLEKYKKKHPNFSLPIICKDSTIRYLFRHLGMPHYAFIAPNGELLIQGRDFLMNPNIIQIIADKAIKRQKLYIKYNFPNYSIKYGEVTEQLLEFLNQNKYIFNDPK